MATALYHLTAATIMAHEAAQLTQGERRLALAKLVLAHKLEPQDPLAAPDDEQDAWCALLEEA